MSVKFGKLSHCRNRTGKRRKPGRPKHPSGFDDDELECAKNRDPSSAVCVNGRFEKPRWI